MLSLLDILPVGSNPVTVNFNFLDCSKELRLLIFIFFLIHEALFIQGKHNMLLVARQQTKEHAETYEDNE